MDLKQCENIIDMREVEPRTTDPNFMICKKIYKNTGYYSFVPKGLICSSCQKDVDFVVKESIRQIHVAMEIILKDDQGLDVLTQKLLKIGTIEDVKIGYLQAAKRGIREKEEILKCVKKFDLK